MTIKPPHHAPDHPDHILDCEEAIEDAVAVVEREAAEAGWGQDVVASALLNLAKAQILALAENRKTEARIVEEIGKRRQ